MLTYDPAYRISAKRALNHTYFANLDKSALPANVSAPTLWPSSLIRTTRWRDRLPRQTSSGRDRPSVSQCWQPDVPYCIITNNFNVCLSQGVRVVWMCITDRVLSDLPSEWWNSRKSYFFCTINSDISLSPYGLYERQHLYNYKVIM